MTQCRGLFTSTDSIRAIHGETRSLLSFYHTVLSLIRGSAAGNVPGYSVTARGSTICLTSKSVPLRVLPKNIFFHFCCTTLTILPIVTHVQSVSGFHSISSKSGISPSYTATSQVPVGCNVPMIDLQSSVVKGNLGHAVLHLLVPVGM